MKQILVLLIAACLSITATAQTASPELSIHAEAGIPNEGNAGFGFFIKGGLGISQAAHLTLQAGFSRFSLDALPAHKAIAIKVIPFLAGYKHHFKGFYLEPQAGYGELNSRVDIGGDYARHSNGAFIWAVGGGYQWKRWVLGVRYQSAVGKAYTGTGSKDQFSFAGLNIGYQLLR